MKNTRPLPLVAIGLLAISSLAMSSLAFAGDRVTGSGTEKTEVRSITGFQAVSASGSIDVVLRQGAKEGVEVRADDNLLPLIETTVVERSGTRTLEIRPARGANYQTRHPVVVTVDLILLNALSMAGSGDVRADSLKAGTFELNLSGSSDARVGQLTADDASVHVAGSGTVKAGGRVSKLAVSIAGSGDVDAGGLQSDDVEVSIAGSGDAKVNASKTLSVTIAGSGDVTYTGDAKLKRKVVGSGNVVHR